MQNRNVCPALEYQLLKDHSTWAVQNYEAELSSVYLRCDSSAMLERLVRRDRISERSMRQGGKKVGEV